MRTSRVLASGLQLFVAIKLLLLGMLCIVVGLVPTIRHTAILLIQNYPPLLPMMGYITLGLGILLFVACYAVHRGQYYQVELGHSIQVDKKIIQDYVHDYWKSLFPAEDVNVEVIMHGNQKIEVIAEIPELPVEEHVRTLEKTEVELGAKLASHIGYKKEFLFTLMVK